MMYKVAFAIYLTVQTSVGSAHCSAFCPALGQFYEIKLAQRYQIKDGKIFGIPLEYSGIGGVISMSSDELHSKFGVLKNSMRRIKDVSVAFELSDNLSFGEAVAISFSADCKFVREEVAKFAKLFKSSKNDNPYVREFVISNGRFKYQLFERSGNCAIDLSLNRFLGKSGSGL
ncbi:hypothetical protein [Ideonella paludis]|uniref:Uncharacterized protein n=1 Tax=Ideonella paludis TaxID=1233411 RepID=A0ABS5DVF1_9BURK|nr:hypothetical protein [Ideonella paludis]MBQ0935112.1 hypothetical protein [Ideonella paludis]